MINSQDQEVRRSSSSFWDNSNLTNIYQRIRQAEYGKGFFIGMGVGLVGFVIISAKFREVDTFFAHKGWPIFVLLLVSALLGMAVQYLYNSYSNRESNQLQVPVVDSTISSNSL